MIGSRIELKVECSARTCSSSSARLFKFSSAPFALHRVSARGTPRLDPLLRLRRSEVVDDVPQPNDPTRPDDATKTVERHGLPEVRKVMQGEPAVDEVGRAQAGATATVNCPSQRGTRRPGTPASGQVLQK